MGEQVRIKSGPFANQVGEVQEIEPDKFKLTVLVDMFGRETPVEVEFDQIENYNQLIWKNIEQQKMKFYYCF